MTGPLVLIEPYAHRLGGHHQHALTALAQARPGSLVIAPYGVAGALAPLREANARVPAGPAGPFAALLLAAARWAGTLSSAGQRAFASRRWPDAVRRAPHQVTLLARCLTEAACLRTARRLAPGAGAVVVLSASEALHGLAALLGGVPHLRFVHENVTTEDAAVRLLGRLARTGDGPKKLAYALAEVPVYLVADPYQGRCHMYTQPKAGEYISELSVAFGADVDMTTTLLGLTLTTDEFPRD